MYMTVKISSNKQVVEEGTHNKFRGYPNSCKGKLKLYNYCYKVRRCTIIRECHLEVRKGLPWRGLYKWMMFEKNRRNGIRDPPEKVVLYFPKKNIP